VSTSGRRSDRSWGDQKGKVRRFFSAVNARDRVYSAGLPYHHCTKISPELRLETGQDAQSLQHDHNCLRTARWTILCDKPPRYLHLRLVRRYARSNSHTSRNTAPAPADHSLPQCHRYTQLAFWSEVFIPPLPKESAIQARTAQAQGYPKTTST
jgi:hypothetical protein